MKKIFIYIAVILTIYACYRILPDDRSSSGKVFAVTSGAQDDEIIKAAKTGMNKFLPMIPPGYENLYGFDSKEDILSADIGTPYKVYSLSAEFLKNGNMDIKNFLYQVNEWRVPVLVSGKMRCLLTVTGENARYKCVDLGGAALAAELNAYDKYFDGEVHERAILRLYQINCDFLSVFKKNSSISTGEFYALNSSTTILGTDKVSQDKVYGLDELLPVIKSKYSEQFNEGKR